MNVHYALQKICACPAEYRVFPRHDLPLRQALPLGEVNHPAADQRLCAFGRVGVWGAGVGSRFQYGGFVDAAADVAPRTPLPEPFCADVPAVMKLREFVFNLTLGVMPC